MTKTEIAKILGEYKNGADVNDVDKLRIDEICTLLDELSDEDLKTAKRLVAFITNYKDKTFSKSLDSVNVWLESIHNELKEIVQKRHTQYKNLAMHASKKKHSATSVDTISAREHVKERVRKAEEEAKQLRNNLNVAIKKNDSLDKQNKDLSAQNEKLKHSLSCARVAETLVFGEAPSPLKDFQIVDGVLTKYYGDGGNVVIPNGVTSIGDYAFCTDGSLKRVVIPDGVTSIGDGAFRGCRSLESITIPNGVTSIGDGAFCTDGSLKRVVIPDGVTSIGDGAFCACRSLESITIPDSVTSIGYDAFWLCESLKSITIPDSVTSIGAHAFSECSALESITIPDSVTSIGYRAFLGCKSLEHITIPDGVKSIGDEAFSYCRLKTFTISRDFEEQLEELFVEDENDDPLKNTRVIYK